MNANLELVDHFERGGIEHPDVVGTAIGYINARQMIGDNGTECVGARLAVEIVRIDHRWHAWDSLNAASGGFRGGYSHRENERRADNEHEHDSRTSQTPHESDLQQERAHRRS